MGIIPRVTYLGGKAPSFPCPISNGVFEAKKFLPNLANVPLDFKGCQKLYINIVN